MVHPGDNVPSQRSNRDLDEEMGYSTPRQQSFIIPSVERRGSSDHMQPSMPSPGEIRSMFGTGRICEYPEYQRPSSTVPDPSEWGTDRHLDDLEEKLLKIRQWSEVTSSHQQSLHEGFREVTRRDASHRMFQNTRLAGDVLYSSDFEVSDAPRFYRGGCSSNRYEARTVSEDDMSSTASQCGYQQEDAAIRGRPCSATRRGSSIFTINEDRRNMTSDEQMVKYMLDREEMNYEGPSHNKAKSLRKLCNIVQSLRRVYEDNKKSCHVVKKLLEIFNLNDDINGKLEGDTKTILKEKFCRFLENSEPELDAYKDINKLFELLESGLTADEESTLQSTLESLCVKLNPDLNRLQYEAVPIKPSEKELLTNDEDEVLIKLHNLSSDLSVTVLEEIDGKTSVVGQSLPKKNSPTNSKRTVTNIPVHLSRATGNQKENNSTVKKQVATTDSNTSATLKQNVTLPRKNFGAFKDDLFKKAITLGFTKEVEELEKSSTSLSRRSQLALLEKKVNGKYKSLQIAEERRKLGAPERINNYKPLVRKKQVDRALSPTSSTMSNLSTTAHPKTPSNLDVEEKVSAKKMGVNKSNRKKIILDILPVLRQDNEEGVEELDNNVKPEIEVSNDAVADDDDDYYASNDKAVVENNTFDDKDNTSSDAVKVINDSDVDDKCFVKKCSSKSSNNRRKTIHAIVTVTCDLSDKSSGYLDLNSVGDEVDKLKTNEEQLPDVVSKESFTVIRSSESEPIIAQADESESITYDVVQEPRDYERTPDNVHNKNDHFMSTIILIFFTMALLYAANVYGNFEFCYDKFDSYQRIMEDYILIVQDRINDYKEKCCKIFAESF